MYRSPSVGIRRHPKQLDEYLLPLRYRVLGLDLLMDDAVLLVSSDDSV